MSKNQTRHKNAFKAGVRKAETAIRTSLMKAIEDGDYMTKGEVKRLISDATASLIEDRVTATEITKLHADHMERIAAVECVTDRPATEWPPMKKAIWDIVMSAELNGGRYVHAFEFVEKIYQAARQHLADAEEAVNFSKFLYADDGPDVDDGPGLTPMEETERNVRIIHRHTNIMGDK